MKQKDIIAIANKIIGIYVLIQALKSAQYVGMSFFVPVEQGHRAWVIATGTVPFLLFVIAGFCLIKWAEPIAVNLSQSNELRDFQPRIKRDDFQQIAFSIVGIVLIADNLPKIVSFLVSLELERQTRQVFVFNKPAFLVEITIKLVVGLILIFGSKRLLDLIKRLRSI